VDREQTHETVKPMTIEEAYEVAHAIDEKDDDELLGELGDLLLQVVFHANIAEERGAFRLKQIIDRVSDKMVRRHPHVFGEDSASTSGTCCAAGRRSRRESARRRARRTSRCSTASTWASRR